MTDDIYKLMGREYAGLVQKQNAEIDQLKATCARLEGDVERLRIALDGGNRAAARAILHDWSKLNRLTRECERCLKTLLSEPDKSAALDAAENILRDALAESRSEVSRDVAGM